MPKSTVSINQLRSLSGDAYVNIGNATDGGIMLECYPGNHYVALIKVARVIKVIAIRNREYVKEYYKELDARFEFGYELIWQSEDIER